MLGLDMSATVQVDGEEFDEFHGGDGEGGGSSRWQLGRARAGVGDDFGAAAGACSGDGDGALGEAARGAAGGDGGGVMGWWKRLLGRVRVEPSLAGGQCYFCEKLLGPFHAHAHEARHGMAVCFCMRCGPRPPADVVRQAHARMIDRCRLWGDPPAMGGQTN